MKTGKLFWVVFGLVLVNLVILLSSSAGSFQNWKTAKISKTVWIESAVLVLASSIPFGNYVALILAVPITLYNLMTKFVPVMNQFYAPKKQSGG